MAENNVIINDDGSVLVVEQADISVVTVEEPTTVVVAPDDSALTVVEEFTQVTVADDATTVIISDVGVQGSAAEEDVPFATRVDFVGETVIYRAQAQPGTLDATNAWRIQEITFVGADEDVEIRWASGNSNFDKIWDDRLSYIYT